jgi:hypothetical protein
MKNWGSNRWNGSRCEPSRRAENVLERALDTFVPPALRALVLSQRDKTHLPLAAPHLSSDR